MGVLIFSSQGCSTTAVREQSQPKGYPIASEVFTTLQRTVVPGQKPSVAIRLDELSKYKKYGYGQWTTGEPLLTEKRTDLMGSAYDGASVTQKTKLLNFFTISDIHITDKESPNQLIYLQQLNAS